MRRSGKSCIHLLNGRQLQRGGEHPDSKRGCGLRDLTSVIPHVVSLLAGGASAF